MGAAKILNLASAVYTASGASATEFDTTWPEALAIDLNVTQFVNGTTPSIQFFLDRQGCDGEWYPVALGAAITATGKVSYSVGLGATLAVVLTERARLSWVFAGAVAADSITFKGSIVGRRIN